ncbi:MAG: hypothetical protein AABY00_02695 [Nanoarchaeota archaeon]
MTFKYSRIFWLEDNPDFMHWLCSTRHTPNADIDNLLSRVTFAFDFEMGRDILSREQFDLYILDGDFPDNSPLYRRDYLQRYLREQCMESMQEGIKGHIVWSNFIKFSKECLVGRQPLVIYSLSERAAVGAYVRQLPFFYKTSDTDGAEKIKEYVKSCEQEFPQGLPNSLDKWELGVDKDLARDYLFAQA